MLFCPKNIFEIIEALFGLKHISKITVRGYFWRILGTHANLGTHQLFFFVKSAKNIPAR